MPPLQQAVSQEPNASVGHNGVRRGGSQGAATASCQPPSMWRLSTPRALAPASWPSHRNTPAAIQGASEADAFVWGTRA